MTLGTLSDFSQQSFHQWWQLNGEWVEQPNQRRGGESGVQRLHSETSTWYAKRQTGHIYRSLRYPFGRPTVLREREALQALDALGIAVPRLIYCAAKYDSQQGWRGLLITEALDGFEDIESWYSRGGHEHCSATQHSQLLQQIGETLARMHLGRWQHGCLYAKHVFVRFDGDGTQVALLDLEKSRQRLSRRKAARHDLKQLRRHSPWSQEDWHELLRGYSRVYSAGAESL